MCLCVAQEMMSHREPMMIALNVCYSKDNNVFSSLMPLWPSFFPSLQFFSHIFNLCVVSWVFVLPFRHSSNLFWLLFWSKCFLLFVVYISLFQISSLTNLFALLFPLAHCICFISPVVLWFSKNDASEEQKKQLSTCKGCRHLFLFMCQNVIWDCAYCTFLKSSNIKNVCQGSYCIMHRNRANVVSTLQVNYLMAAQRVNTLPGLVCRTRHY